MNTKELFLNRLKDLLVTARSDGQEISDDMIKAHFQGMNLDQSQLDMIRQYLSGASVQEKAAPSQDLSDDHDISEAENESAAEEDSLDDRYDLLHLNIPQMDDTDVHARLYLDEIAEGEYLSPSIRKEAFLKLAEGDESKLSQLVNFYLRLVASIAFLHSGKGVSLLDMIQEGNICLIDFMEQAGGFKDFMSFEEGLERRILSCMEVLTDQELDFNRKQSEIVSLMNRVTEVQKHLALQEGHEPTLGEVASYLGLDSEYLKDMMDLAKDEISFEKNQGMSRAFMDDYLADVNDPE